MVKFNSRLPGPRPGWGTRLESSNWPSFCLDVHTAVKACRYLDELGREDAIPPEALEPDFRAMAEFSQWLAHPNELGRPPNELEIVDRRELAWPPEFDRKTLWLIRYRLRETPGSMADDVGLGLVGSITFCLADDNLHERPHEDAYAAHCYWELEARGYVTEAEVEDDSTEYDGMLRQITLTGLGRPRIIRVIELSPELRYPQRLIAVARASATGTTAGLSWTDHEAGGMQNPRHQAMRMEDSR